MTPVKPAGTAGRSWSVASAPGPVPLLGHTLALWRRPLAFLASLPARGDLVEVRLGPRRAYLACDPELVRHVLLNPRTFDKGGVFEKARLLLGNSLSVSRGEDHRAQRRLIQPAFRPARIAAYAAAVSDDTQRAIGSWRPGRVLEVGEAMHLLLMRVAARTLFSAGMDDRTVDEAQRCLRTVSRGIHKRTVAPLGVMERLPTPGNREYARANTRLREIVRELITERARSGTGEDDLLSTLLGGGPEPHLSDREVLDQVVTFLVAGSETTASTLSFVFHLLDAHPDVERRVHEEIDTVLGGRSPGFDDLPRLETVRNVVSETLRLYPPSWMSMRVTAVDTEIGERHIPAGTTILYSAYALHHDPASFPDPERFVPDRWAAGRRREMPRDAFLPFGAGTHKCIGDVLAVTETALIVATVAGRWRLRRTPGTSLRPEPRATLGPGPLPMVCEPR